MKSAFSTDVPAGDPPLADGLPPSLARLEDLLWRELDEYRCLTDILLREKEILTRNAPEELPELLEEQKRVLHEVRTIETSRTAALRQVANEVGFTGDPNLTRLCEALDGDARRRMQKLRDALAHVVPRVDQVNRINVLLIRNSMSFISTTVKAILDEDPENKNTTYSPRGHVPTNDERPSWTDRRA